jgi:hypothetical protein
MARNFSTTIFYNKQSYHAVFIPQMRPDGLHYEVNIKSFPRFYMVWSAIGRFDVLPGTSSGIPYELILAASDAIDEHHKRA